MDWKTLLKIHENYRYHLLQNNKLKTRNRNQRVTDAYTFLRYLKVNNKKLTKTLTEYDQEYYKYCHENYVRTYALTKIRHTKEFQKWYKQYVEVIIRRQKC